MSRVTVTNPYDLLTDENEDRTNVPAPKKEQKPAAPAAKTAAKPAATGVAKAAAKPAAPKAEGAKAPAKTDAKAAPKPAGGNSSNQAVKPAPIRDSNQNLQERDKESRPPRDKRDHRQPVTGDKKGRTFDRKSGTGRLPGEVKKGGQGKGNWGGDVDPKDTADAIKEAKDNAEEKVGDEENKEEKVAVEGEKKEGETKDETPAAPAEPETFTLDEYLAKKTKSSISGIEALKPRTVTAEEFGAAGLVPLQRGEQGTAPLQAKDSKKAEKKPAAASPATEKPAAAAAGDKKEKKNLAAELLNFASHEDRRRSERPFRNYENRQGGERRPRGGARGGFRGNNNNSSQDSRPPVQEKDFPTLNVKA